MVGGSSKKKKKKKCHRGVHDFPPKAPKVKDKKEVRKMGGPFFKEKKAHKTPQYYTRTCYEIGGRSGNTFFFFCNFLHSSHTTSHLYFPPTPPTGVLQGITPPPNPLTHYNALPFVNPFSSNLFNMSPFFLKQYSSKVVLPATSFVCILKI